VPRWFSIAAIFIITAFVLHAFLVIVSLAAGVVSGQGLLTMAGPVTFLVEFGLAAVITYFIVRPRGGVPAQMSPEEQEKHDADLEADARRRVHAIEKQYRDEQRLERLKAEVVKWREARDLRAYANEALEDLGGDDVQTAEGGSLREELEWALEYADSIDPLRAKG
jgi:hypothetical protein